MPLQHITPDFEALVQSSFFDFSGAAGEQGVVDDQHENNPNNDEGTNWVSCAKVVEPQLAVLNDWFGDPVKPEHVLGVFSVAPKFELTNQYSK
jgi:hypothetical protein